MTKTSFKRVLLKISGEALMGEGEYGIEAAMVDSVSPETSKMSLKLGIEVCLRGRRRQYLPRRFRRLRIGMDRAAADYMGMLATVINSLALQERARKTRPADPWTLVQPIPMATVCEPYIRRRALHHMEKGRVVIFAAGTGNPLFTTDTAAALRASEMGCDALLKGTKVDGVPYTADPMKFPTATKFDNLTYMDVLSKDLGVMDAAAISLARENKIPVIIFSIMRPGAFAELMQGRGECTVVMEKKEVKNA